MVPEKLSISCKLNNHLTELTIDIRSSENVLSYAKAKELNLFIKKSQTNTIIQVVSSKFLNILGYTDTILNFLGLISHFLLHLRFLTNSLMT
ncbi:hypothetical protein HERIO_2273 [Hepatospora eriocheir]|uniref:Uncharacterized protein n=1 Tax=Hepatospora eriocheir TaxID=1081669 RepID=A0A1X0Q7J2_9MICR|nr:hypothetical protein HERIO_2273 [Hepatospora eriocheir]